MKILIPEHVWVGAMPKNRTCEITAWGTDATSKKRMLTVAHHVGGEQNCVKLANTPQTGFEIIRSMWKDTFLVRDPRGFDFVITAQMLTWFLKESTVVNGVIMAPCVYGRMSGALMLLNTQSRTHAQAVTFTQVNQSKESWRNVKPGNRIILRTGVTGTYMGKYHVLYHRIENNHDVSQAPLILTHNRLTLSNKWMHVILEDASHHSRKMHILQNPPLAKIMSQDQVPPAKAEAQVNHLLSTKGVYVNHYWWSTPLILAAEPLTQNQIQIQVTTQDTTPAGIQSWFLSPSQGNRHLSLHQFGRLASGEMAKISVSRTGASAYLVHEASFAQGEFRHIMKRGSSGTYYVDDSRRVVAAEVSELCDIHACLSTQLGNQIKIKLE